MKKLAICVPVVLFLAFTQAAAWQAGSSEDSPLPKLPADIPENAAMFMVLTDRTPSGQDAVWTAPDGTIHEMFQFNDRGRGPQIYTDYRLDAKGMVLAEDSHGVDYMKNPVQEHFMLNAGKASWKNQAEDRQAASAERKFFVGLNSGPQADELLARALLNNGSRVAVLPSGSATIRPVKLLTVSDHGQPIKATLYEISGLSFTPSYVWLDEARHRVAQVQGWFAIVRAGLEPAIAEFRKAQEEVENARSAELAARLATQPAGDLVIRNTRLFDSGAGKVVEKQRVTVRADRIVAVEGESGQPTPRGATVIDGTGKMVLPGLWDMHAHLDKMSAYMNIAAGVTTVRDLGNSIEQLTDLRHQIESGKAIGPRVVTAGFIDGPGPFEGPIKVLAATPEEARERVDHYADLGYVQIKIYSSVKPELVPVIIEEAHKRGLRVSGHVPAGMIASEFIRDGADEVQHMNFVFLNFMPDVKETRTPARFIEPGRRGAALDLNSPEVNDFIALLKQHHTVIDSTLAIWEATFTDRQGQIPLSEAAMFSRLPAQVQRADLAGGEGLPVPDAETDRLYRASYANMEHMLKRLYDSGVQLVAGTDIGTGYALHRELEIYVHAGIPAPEVLRMATLGGARVMHRDGDLGSVAAGKFADLILVDGDPTRQISDIRKISLVVNNGKLLRPAELYREIGVR